MFRDFQIEFESNEIATLVTTSNVLDHLSCALCGFRTEDDVTLREHYSKAHNELVKPNVNNRKAVGSSTKDVKYSCTLCPYKTLRAAFLQHHQKMHESGKIDEHGKQKRAGTKRGFPTVSKLYGKAREEIKCNKCEFHSDIEALAKEHFFSHFSGPPFACDLC